jgi:hypothetical protein
MPSRECAIVEEDCIHGRTQKEVQQLAATFHLSQTHVARLLQLHGERLEEKLLEDREGLLCAAGLGHVESDAASLRPASPPPATPPLPSGPEASCPEPEPDAPFSLSLGHDPNTSILEARASSLHRLAADCGTIRSALECSTGGTIPLPLVANGDAMRTTLQFYDALGPYDASATSDSAWHSVTPSDEDRAWCSVKPTEDRALFDLIRVANYLETSILLKQALTALGTRLRGQTAAQLRERFGLPNWPEDVTEKDVRAAEAESHFEGEPEELLPTVKRGTTGINVGDSELLVQALNTLETSALCVLKGVNPGMRSAVRQLLCRPDMQAERFTTIELVEQKGGAPEAVRLRRKADPLEPECGWHQVGDKVVVKRGVGHNVQIVSPTGLPIVEQAWVRREVYSSTKVLCVIEVGREPFPTGPSYTVEAEITKTETDNAGVVTSTDLKYVLSFPANDLIADSWYLRSAGRFQQNPVSALYYAARRGDSAMVAVLIEGECEKHMPADYLWDCAAIMVHGAHEHCLRTFLGALTALGHDPDDGRKFAWLVKAIEGAQKLTRKAGAPHPSVAMLAFLLKTMRAPVEHNIAQYTDQHRAIPVTLPLHAAASLGNLDMVGMLLDHGANAELCARGVTACPWHMRQPLWFAERAGHSEVAQLLRTRMAPGAANA